ncbi:hypothetical protein AB9R17_07765 [Neisseria gonorrhoeae]
MPSENPSQRKKEKMKGIYWQAAAVRAYIRLRAAYPNNCCPCTTNR